MLSSRLARRAEESGAIRGWRGGLEGVSIGSRVISAVELKSLRRRVRARQLSLWLVRSASLLVLLSKLELLASAIAISLVDCRARNRNGRNGLRRDLSTVVRDLSTMKEEGAQLKVMTSERRVMDGVGGYECGKTTSGMVARCGLRDCRGMNSMREVHE